MRIATWNVNGIRACSSKDHGFFEFLEKYDPDIFCIQETKAHPGQLSEKLIDPLNRKGYFSSAKRKGYSGTATFVKNQPEKVEHGIGIKKYDDEGRFVVTTHKDFVLYNVYFPNGASREERHDYKQEFLYDFTEHLKEEHLDHKQPVILVGDYNVAYLEHDVFDPVRLSKVSGFLPEERDWFHYFLNTGFVDVFRHFYPDKKDIYSWWSYRERARKDNRGWRIDHICVSNDLIKKVKSIEIVDQQMGSDHCPIVMDISL